LFGFGGGGAFFGFEVEGGDLVLEIGYEGVGGEGFGG
jgi:hypothetical protein